MKKILSALVIALPIATSVSAATDRGSLNIQLEVQKSCSLNTDAVGTSLGNSVLNFGQVSNFEAGASANSSATSGSGAINILCNTGTPWKLTFDGGLNAFQSQRYLSGATGETVPYNLYADAAKTAVIANNGSVTGTGTGSPQAYTVYGAIPSGTALPSPGIYQDTVGMTISF